MYEDVLYNKIANIDTCNFSLSIEFVNSYCECHAFMAMQHEVGHAQGWMHYIFLSPELMFVKTHSDPNSVCPCIRSYIISK